MHETALMKDLVRQVESVVTAEHGARAVAVEIWLGALSHLSAAHFLEHFTAAALGSVADGAALDITVSDDIAHPRAQDVVLRRVDVED